MKIFILFTLLLSLKPGICLPQDSIIIIHPQIGEIIDSSEKTDFLLFPEIPATYFKYGFIKNFDNTLYLCSFDLNDSISVRQIDTIEINQYKLNIDKLKVYYSNQQKNDSLEQIKTLILNLNAANYTKREFKLINEDTSLSMAKELLLKNRLRDDAERLRRKEQQGSFSNDVLIEFP